MEIIVKIYFTLILVLVFTGGTSWLLMNSETNRETLWYKIAIVSFIISGILVFIGGFVSIWI